MDIQACRRNISGVPNFCLTDEEYKAVSRFYLYDFLSGMYWQGEYWTFSFKRAKLFLTKEEAEAESKRQYAILNKIL